MHVFKAKPKKWGNSLGITLPRDIVAREAIKENKEIEIIIVGDSKEVFKNVFGTLKAKRPTQEMLDEVDREFGE